MSAFSSFVREKDGEREGERAGRRASEGREGGIVEADLSSLLVGCWCVLAMEILFVLSSSILRLGG